MERQNIHIVTLRKVERFLQEQTEPIFKSHIVRELGVDYNSVNFALTLIKPKTDKRGRIYLC